MAPRIKEVKKLEKSIEERQAITGMIVDSNFLKQIRPIVKLDYFKTPFTRTVADWCINYFDQYEEAPGETIEDIFKAKDRAGDIEEKLVNIIEQFLESISNEYSHSDNRPTEYLLRNTELYFKLRSVEILKEDIVYHLTNKDVDSLHSLLSTYNLPERHNGGWINPFNDQEAIKEAFTHSVEPLFTLPGKLGELFGGILTRDALIGIMGPEKRGKTWWLMYLAKRAAMARLNIAFFAVGDMTQPQMTIRFHVMHAGKSNKKRYCGAIKVPVLDCLYNQNDECDMFERPAVGKVSGEFEDNLDHKPCSYCAKDKKLNKKFKGAIWWKIREAVEPLDWREAIKSGEEFVTKAMQNKQLRLSCHPNTSINIKGIEGILDNWEVVDGFIPDVVLIDYADILAPETGRRDFRHQQNETWKAMRALSQTKNCLVITATQADAASYKKNVIDETNFSEDKRKYSHVTGVITLNQNREEKIQGIMRIGTMFLRDDDFDTNRTVTVLQSLATGKPVIASYFSDQPKKER